MMPVHPPGRPMWSTFEEDAEKSMLADKLGFEEVWLGEHFTATTEPFPSPMMFFAALLPRTKSIKFGTAVINLPNHHPAIVAAEAAQFDHMSKGRFMMGVGPGGLVSDFELFKVPDVHGRNRMVVEATNMIREDLDAGPALRSSRRVLEHQDDRRRSCRSSASASCRSRTRQPHPPISISLASPNSSSARTAAEQGWGMHVRQHHPDLFGCQPLGRLQRGLRRARQEAASGENWRVSRNMLVAPTDAEAEERVFGADASNRYFFTYIRDVLNRVGILMILKPQPRHAGRGGDARKSS